MHRRPAALLIGLALVACSDGGDEPATIGRDGSVLVDDVDAPRRPSSPPRAYAITYELQRLDDGEVERSTAELLVERPYRSRFHVVSDERDDVWVADFAVLGEDGEVRSPPPQPAVDDIRGDLLAAGRDAVETREVAGRTCWVHRFGGPVTDRAVTPGADTDVCIDAGGLVLEQVEREGDDVVRRWIATSVDTSPAIDDDDFRAEGEVVPADQGGGDVREVTPTSRSVGQFFELDEPPAGFAHRGRYAIVPPQDARVDSPETRARVLAGVVDVYERGIDVVVIDQGGTLGKVPAFGAVAHSTPIDLGDLGELGAAAADAAVFPTTTGGEVRVLIAPGRYLRVIGTLPADDLVDVARSVRPVEGTGLVYADE